MQKSVSNGQESIVIGSRKIEFTSCFQTNVLLRKTVMVELYGFFDIKTKHEKYDKKNIRGKAKGGDLFQMIWECFVGNKLGPIVFINGMVNTNGYISLLQDNLLPFIDALIADG